MRINEVRARAKAVGIKGDRKPKEALIREIQRAEGNRECYNSGQKQACGQLACLWRDDCK